MDEYHQLPFHYRYHLLFKPPPTQEIKDRLLVVSHSIFKLLKVHKINYLGYKFGTKKVIT